MVSFLNDTRNQHFLSQAEQRLNTCTPDAAAKNQRIYEFEVLRRGADAKLGDPRNPRIRANLAIDDVFTFDVLPRSNLRQNFEAMFQQYETDLVARTDAVLAKADARAKPREIRDDLMSLFAVKFLNFLRNPHSVPKMMDTFARVSTFRPTDPEMDKQLDLVLSGNKPHQAELCNRLGLTEQQYSFWLGTQFMMLNQLKVGAESLFDGIVRDLFTKKTTAVLVTISRYTRDGCLLSDRSVSSSIAKLGVDCMEFNLRHDAFIRYAFTNRAALLRPDVNERHAKLLEQMEPTLVVDYRVDDRDQLAMYNLNVVNWSHRHVYCAVDQGILIAIESKG